MIRFAAAAFFVLSTVGVLAAGCAAGGAPTDGAAGEQVGQTDEALGASDVIVEYYSDATFTDMVGFYQRDCDHFVDSWGVGSAYVKRWQQTCDGTGQGSPQCFFCTPTISLGTVDYANCSLDFCPDVW
jgi:hypothetical protein